MSYDPKEGDDVLIPSMGVVHVTTVYPSGAAVVIDADGVRWLCQADLISTGEPCLFSVLP